ncbi:MAG: sigma-54-dependent Fis family transcriptional regulator, partial [Deltaproteobacteria bacterium]|nr:sigma-54-dependent Fis family transcriptional regulator [Deltaproteobacteria bacterium]
GESKAIQDVLDFVNQVAKSPDTPVLLSGETGTGKELIASAIHHKSPNFKGPFITVNCAAIPKELIESELFGYDKGAFSGARASGKTGMVEEAAGGTLFLDEVADMSLEAQAKLLRFLEDGEYYRVGGTKKLRVTTRVVSATNKSLDQLIKQAQFRQDLFYRLAVIKVEIPRLTKRTDDILPIARHFLVNFSTKFDKPFTGIEPEAEQILIDHTWTGNIRELKNTIERAVLTGQGPRLRAADIALATAQTATDGNDTKIRQPVLQIPSDGVDLKSLLQETEKRYIQLALQQADGNESRAARLLGLNYYTFRHRRKKLLDA